jgi:transposase InsO family protein
LIWRHLPLRPRLQYTSAKYRQFAQDHDVILSISRTGDRFDNAVAESFSATLKRELIRRRPWPTRAGLRQARFDTSAVGTTPDAQSPPIGVSPDAQGS